VGVAGDYQQLAPQDWRVGSLETKENARNAGISGPFSGLLGGLTKRWNGWLGKEGTSEWRTQNSLQSDWLRESNLNQLPQGYEPDCLCPHRILNAQVLSLHPSAFLLKNYAKFCIDLHSLKGSLSDSQFG
jgi:hypothetical protein